MMEAIASYKSAARRTLYSTKSPDMLALLYEIARAVGEGRLPQLSSRRLRQLATLCRYLNKKVSRKCPDTSEVSGRFAHEGR